MKISELDVLVRAVCPIDGINSGGVISFRQEATVGQRSAAQALMDANLPTLTETLTHNEIIYKKIRELESSESMARPLRDLVKTATLAAATTAGYTLEQVYAITLAQGEAAPESAKAWKKFKDFDDAIQALKAQRI